MRKGAGIKFLDGEVELASYKTLLGIYGNRITVTDPNDIDAVVFSFQKYLCREFQDLYFPMRVLATSHVYEEIERRYSIYKESIRLNIPMMPSHLLADILYLKTFRPPDNLTQLSCCIKLRPITVSK